MRYLILDEHIESSIAQRIMLVSRGHDCAIARTAQEALRLLDMFEPEVILLEWNLRDGSGVGLAPLLRNHLAYKGQTVRIIAVSTQAEPEGFARRERVDAYLTKPVTAAQIEFALDSLKRRGRFT